MRSRLTGTTQRVNEVRRRAARDAMACVVRNLTRGTVIADRAAIADTVARRLRGLIGRGKLENGEGLVLTPCGGIHMFMMRMPLDVIFLSEHGQVLCAVSALPTWSVLPWIRAATSAIEVPVGTVHMTRTAPGDLVSIERDLDATGFQGSVEPGAPSL